MLQAAEIFQNGMIVQRNKPVALWGQAESGARVSALMQGKGAQTTADAQGNWQLFLPALTASEGETLEIASKEERLLFTDVAVGEVWLAGGQSNMEFHMRYEKHLPTEKATCPNRRLRFYDVPEVCFDGQREAYDYSRMAVWRSATADDLEYFSAVGYYFQKEISGELDVPVGIIGCNWGGTTASVWMREASVKTVGKVWMDDYLSQIEGKDMDEYWQRQLHMPGVGRGNPFEDPFGEFVLPRTPSAEEILAALKKLGLTPESFENTEMAPQTVPGCLYEHMLKTVAPFSLRGFLWYQGESDDVAGRQELYKEMLTALIGDWRALWQDKDLPFLFVQLPAWERWLAIKNENYEALRLSQEQVAKTVPGVYICSISDAGEQNDIHPKNKMIVGHRLALLARGHVYGENLLCDAPQMAKVYREGADIVIEFVNTGGGLLTGDFAECGWNMNTADRGDEIKENAAMQINALKVCADGIEIGYHTEIDGQRVIIHLHEPAEGKIDVAFAQDKWYVVNLYNQAKIPAMPFMVQC